jgi:ornithine carbamoyltransferase
MRVTGNPDVKFLHCLPTVHSTETPVDKQIHHYDGFDALEVTDDVVEAKNRLPTFAAIVVATLGGEPCALWSPSAVTPSRSAASR